MHHPHTPFHRPSRLGLAFATATVFGLGACGSGGGDPAPAPVVAPVASTLITGTAASGAAIIGKVTVKDSTGAQKTVDIEANGRYTVDVSGMTAPFLFRAVGNVGGREVSLASTATAADVGKTINITPFTDLVVANIAGMAAAQFYEAPAFALLTAAEIDAARNQLTARLQPILNALGVEAGFDLLRTAFAADHTQFDAVMDVVKVTVDAATQTATITDLVNNTRIADDLASRADTSVLPAPLTAPGGTVSDLVAIDQLLKNITALFATGIPAASNATLRNALASDFLDDGATLEQFLSPDRLLSVENIGLKLLSATLLQRVDERTLWATLAGSDATESWSDKVQFTKGSDGVWRLAGNRQVAGIHIDAINDRWMGSSPPSFNRRLEFWVEAGASNRIQYATVTGPGLGQAVGLVRSAADDENFHIEGYSYFSSWLNECSTAQDTTPCVNFSQVPHDAVYTVTWYDHKNGTPYPTPTTLVLPRPPASNAEAMANASAWFASFSPANFLPLVYQDWTDGSGITLAWARPTSSSHRMAHLGMNAQTTRAGSPTTVAFRKDLGATETSAQLGNWSGAAPTSAPNFWIFTKDPYNRHFVTTGNYPGR